MGPRVSHFLSCRLKSALNHVRPNISKKSTEFPNVGIPAQVIFAMSRPSQKRSARPLLENLEDRLLLYSTYGGTWVYGSRITYSFMPDGTNVGGISSVLFQTLDAKFSQATWELQFKKAAAVWQAV